MTHNITNIQVARPTISYSRDNRAQGSTTVVIDNAAYDCSFTVTTTPINPVADDHYHNAYSCDGHEIEFNELVIIAESDLDDHLYDEVATILEEKIAEVI